MYVHHLLQILFMKAKGEYTTLEKMLAFIAKERSKEERKKWVFNQHWF